MTFSHAIDLGLRPAHASAGLTRRLMYKLRALTEIPAGRRYRATYGRESYSSADLDAMWAADLPVSKRPTTPA